MVIREISPELIDHIRRQNLWVLRRKKDGYALNVSYSVYGLQWTCNKLGRALMYRRAFISKGRLIGDLAPSKDVYVEVFVPRNHDTEAAQVAEFTWVDKALRLIY